MSGHASGEAVVAATIGMVVLAGVVVLLRLFTRVFIVKSPGWDDAFIAGSLLFSIATTVTMCLQGPSTHRRTCRRPLQQRSRRMDRLTDHYRSPLGHGPTPTHPHPLRIH